MTTITLWDCATAPSPRRTRILLAEKGVKYDTVQVDLLQWRIAKPAGSRSGW